MKTMIWKELRENRVWAVLMLLASLTLILMMISDQMGWRLDLRLFPQHLPEVYAALGIVVAVVLGCLQTLPELSRDRWAFLMHRGTSARHIFRAKAITAAFIYVLVLGLPLFLIALWMWSVGYERYPFRWWMLLPTVWMSIAAFGFYFAVYHAVLRERGFPLWRLLPLGPPIGAICVIFMGMDFSDHVSWLVGGMVLLLTAISAVIASRTMISQGAMQDFGRAPGRTLVATNFLTLLALLGTGLGCCWLIATWVMFDVLDYDRKIMIGDDNPWTNAWIGTDGEVMEWTLLHEGWDKGVNESRSKLLAIRNLNDSDDKRYQEHVGESRLDSKRTKLMSVAEYTSMSGFTSVLSRTQNTQPLFQDLSMLGPVRDSMWKERNEGTEQEKTAPAYARTLTWHMSTADGAILGYSHPRVQMENGRQVRRSPKLHSVIGPDGVFRYPDWPKKRFGKCLASAIDFTAPHQPYYWNEIVAVPKLSPIYLFENGLFQIDLQESRVTELLAPPPGKTIQAITAFGEGEERLAVFLNDEVRICKSQPHAMGWQWTDVTPVALAEDPSSEPDEKDAGELEGEFAFGEGFDDSITYERKQETITVPLPGELLMTVPIPADVRQARYLSVTYNEDRNKAWFVWYSEPWLGPTTLTEVDVSAADPASAAAMKTYVSPLQTQTNMWQTSIITSIGAMTPLAFAAGLWGFEELRFVTTGHSLLASATHTFPVWLWAFGTALVLSSLLSAFLGRLYANRFGLEASDRRRWFWTGLFLGLAGVLALVTTRHCPARVRCSSCQRRRVVTRTTCEHCQAAFESPRTNGTEIFA